MNEEEKKAIEGLFHLAHINTYLDLEKNGVIKISRPIIERWKDETKILLNLIDKQQKEIENYQILKDDIEGHNVAYVDTPEFEEIYISKDKIEEKIKELESHVWRDGYMTKFDRYAIHYLKELLGE